MQAVNPQSISFKISIPQDGTITREWSFEQPLATGTIVRFPFRFWSLSLAQTEMKNADIRFKSGAEVLFAKVVTELAVSVLRSSGDRKNLSRSYLHEAGYFEVDIGQKAQLLSATDFEITIRISDKIFTVPNNLSESLVRLIKELTP